MDQADIATRTGADFDFLVSTAGLITVLHRGHELRWDFIVEVANGRRFLQPLKNRMNAIDRRSTAPLRRQAFAFAVAEARGRDVID